MVLYLQKVIRIFKVDCASTLEFLTTLHSELQPPSKVISAGNYANWISRVYKSLAPAMLMKIGQLQLIRKRIQYQLKMSANLNAKQLFSAVEVANRYQTILKYPA
jgi:hypothetical protein